MRPSTWPDTVNSAQLGTFHLQGGQRLGVPVKFFPGADGIVMTEKATVNSTMTAVSTHSWAAKALTSSC